MKKRLWFFFMLAAIIAALILAACGGEEGDDDDDDDDDDDKYEYNPDGDKEDGDSESGGELIVEDGDEFVDGDNSEESIDGDEFVDGDEFIDGDESVDGDEQTDGDEFQPDGDGPGPNCPAMIEAGMNNGFMVNGESRSFLVHFPTDVESGGPWPVVFNWHGYGDTASNMAGLFSQLVNNSTMPFILITPEDTNIQLPNGVDWDILKVYPNNKEAAMFDTILDCLDWQYGIDEDHIHTVGFSAGSIMSDMLGVLRGEEIASIATWSGGYFSNQANVDILDNMIKSYVSWPAMEVTNNYSQIIISGGSNDQFGQSILGYNIYIHFDQMAANDITWLNGRGHDLVTCSHTQGHTAPAGISPSLIINFFAAHPKGVTDSPYMNGLPVGWPTWCGVSPSN